MELRPSFLSFYFFLSHAGNGFSAAYHVENDTNDSRDGPSNVSAWKTIGMPNRFNGGHSRRDGWGVLVAGEQGLTSAFD